MFSSAGDGANFERVGESAGSVFMVEASRIKVYPKTDHNGGGGSGEGLRYSSTLATRCMLVGNATPRPLYPLQRNPVRVV